MEHLGSNPIILKYELNLILYSIPHSFHVHMKVEAIYCYVAYKNVSFNYKNLVVVTYLKGKYYCYILLV